MKQALMEAEADGRIHKNLNRKEYNAVIQACLKKAKEIYAQANFLFLLGEACKPSMRHGFLRHGL